MNHEDFQMRMVNGSIKEIRIMPSSFEQAEFEKSRKQITNLEAYIAELKCK